MNGWETIAQAASFPAASLNEALRHPGSTQASVLRQIIAKNADTAFGVEHSFQRLKTYDDYADAVPVRRYEDFEPWIARVAAGEDRVLTSDPAVAFERTGGSTSGGKLIPYTTGLLSSFRAAVLPWLGGLLQRRPSIGDGRAFVSISPQMRAPETTPGGLRIGLPSDAAYLGEDLAPALAEIIVNGSAAASATTLDDWQILALCDLVRADDLSFISVWSPTFLTRLLDVLADEADRVLSHLGDATEAKARMEAALREGVLRSDILWPRLDTISCWADGPSKPFAERLANQFPKVFLEPKGLLATECPITLPMGFEKGNVPALSSAFFEFVGASEQPRLAGEITCGNEYRVLITSPGGLYRYDTGDTVRCEGWEEETPLLRFVGRGGLVSDLVGEKLTDEFVAGALSDLPVAAMLVAQLGPRPFYELWVDSDQQVDPASIEDKLCANPQYSYARRLGQLGPLRLLRRPGFVHALHAQRAMEGGRFGDLKAQALLPWTSRSRRAVLLAGISGRR